MSDFEKARKEIVPKDFSEDGVCMAISQEQAVSCTRFTRDEHLACMYTLRGQPCTLPRVEGISDEEKELLKSGIWCE